MKSPSKSWLKTNCSDDKVKEDENHRKKLVKYGKIKYETGAFTKVCNLLKWLNIMLKSAKLLIASH